MWKVKVIQSTRIKYLYIIQSCLKCDRSHSHRQPISFCCHNSSVQPRHSILVTAGGQRAEPVQRILNHPAGNTCTNQKDTKEWNNNKKERLKSLFSFPYSNAQRRKLDKYCGGWRDHEMIKGHQPSEGLQHSWFIARKLFSLAIV